jgi:hypothetical protein
VLVVAWGATFYAGASRVGNATDDVRGRVEPLGRNAEAMGVVMVDTERAWSRLRRGGGAEERAAFERGAAGTRRLLDEARALAKAKGWPQLLPEIDTIDQRWRTWLAAARRSLPAAGTAAKAPAGAPAKAPARAPVKPPVKAAHALPGALPDADKGTVKAPARGPCRPLPALVRRPFRRASLRPTVPCACST